MSEAMRDWASSLFGSRNQQQEKPAAPATSSSWYSRMYGSRNMREPTTPTSRGGARNQGPFQFKRGDVRGNLQQILQKAESPDYITLAGGKKVQNLRDMTVAEIGKQFGNKAAGRYQIQRNTAFDALKNAGLDPNTFKFDEKGQDKIFELLLERRGYKDYKAGRISKEEFASRLSMEWAGLPKNRSGKSFHAGVGNNKAHVAWDDVLRALD